MSPGSRLVAYRDVGAVTMAGGAQAEGGGHRPVLRPQHVLPGPGGSDAAVSRCGGKVRAGVYL